MVQGRQNRYISLIYLLLQPHYYNVKQAAPSHHEFMNFPYLSHSVSEFCHSSSLLHLPSLAFSITTFNFIDLLTL